jgi:hypothetical protein
LIPDYHSYSPYSDAILRDAWNYLVSIMPFELPSHLTYDYYRNGFYSWTQRWAGFTRTRRSDPSVQFWIHYDAAEAAQAILAAKSENERVYDFLQLEDEQRLNRVIKEIDPAFIPVDTSRSRVTLAN